MGVDISIAYKHGRERGQRKALKDLKSKGQYFVFDAVGKEKPVEECTEWDEMAKVMSQKIYLCCSFEWI